MKTTLIASALSMVCAVGAVGCATKPATAPAKQVAPAAVTQAPTQPAPARKYSTSETLIGDLLDNPKTRAVLDKEIPGFSSAPQVDMARGMTLKAIQPYARDTLSDAVLAKVDAAFATLTP
jgi:hypothetical protein